MLSEQRRIAATALIGLTLSSACSSRLPPLAAPSRSVPVLEVEPAPPVEGQGRVAFDAENVKGAAAEIVAGRSYSTGIAATGTTNVTAYGYGESTVPICKTPCVANLPYGNYQVKFTAPFSPRGRYLELTDIQVGTAPSVVRTNIGHESPSSTSASLVGILLAALGGAAAITGAAFVAFKPDLGVPLLIGGGVGLGAGGLVLKLNPYESQAGQTVQFQPADGTIYRRK